MQKLTLMLDKGPINIVKYGDLYRIKEQEVINELSYVELKSYLCNEKVRMEFTNVLLQIEYVLLVIKELEDTKKPNHLLRKIIFFGSEYETYNIKDEIVFDCFGLIDENNKILCTFNKENGYLL